MNPCIEPSPLPARRALHIAAAVIAWLAVASAQAHHAWMIPSASVLTGSEAQVSVDAAISEDLFEYDTNALQLDGLAVTGPDGNPVTAENRSTARRRTSFDLKLTQPGTYRISNYAEQVIASYKIGGETKRWRGTPEALEGFRRELPAGAQDLQVTRMQNRVETFVTVGKPSDKAFTVRGTGLEMVPLSSPTDLSVGDSSSFRLLLDGKPVASADVTILRGGNRYRYKMGEIALKTDGDGRFSVKWPEAGRYWIGSVHGRRGPGDAPPAAPEPPPRRASYSATVEVLPQ